MSAFANHEACHQGRWIPAVALLFGWIIACTTIGKEAANATTPEALIDQARQAEIEGDTARQFSLLREVVRLAPESKLARWQLGQLEVGDKWVSVEDAERIAAADPRQWEYRQLRKLYGESLDGQLTVARWCRKNGLDEEARFHWASVLGVRPGYEEALRALGLRLYHGRPVSPEQIAAAKQEAREAKRVLERWEPKVAKWRRAISSPDAAARGAALDEIRALCDVAPIPAIEDVTLGPDAFRKHESDECRQISLAFVEALTKMPEQPATLSLARYAAMSPSPDVRGAAIGELKARPMYEFVPQLLDALEMPIESSFSVTTDLDGSVHYHHSLYREGIDSDWAYDTSQSVMRRPGSVLALRRGGKVVEEDIPATNARASSVPSPSQSQAEFARTSDAVESAVYGENQSTDALNSRIIPVLASITGKEFGSAKQWWDWWNENNEYYVSNHPVQYEGQSSTNGNDTYYYRLSCFVRGTPVWTKTGQRPIETLALGDLVLAQDVNTGELAYKPVIGRTVRPPSPMVTVSLGGEQIQATRGHLFWVAGVGWQMAKELKDGAVLHGVTGSSRIAIAKEAEPAEAYNLVVDEFNTYFVGESGLLVHDNTPRKPSKSKAPALAVK